MRLFFIFFGFFVFIGCAGKQVERDKNLFLNPPKKIHLNKILNHTSFANLENEMMEASLAFFHSQSEFVYTANYREADYILTIAIEELTMAFNSTDFLDSFLKGVIVLDKMPEKKSLKSEFIVFLEEVNQDTYNQNLDKIKDFAFTKFLGKLELWLEHNTR